MTKKKSAEDVQNASAHAGSVDPAVAAMTYEEAVRELEALVGSIEQGDVGLEQSLASYRRGEQLVRHCKALLDRAETTVRQLSVGELEVGTQERESPTSR